MGSSLGSSYASNDDLEVVEGYAAESADGHTTWTYPRRWNGAIRYSVSNDQHTSSTAPTDTSADIPKPSSYPSLLPSKSPTSNPEMPSDTPSSDSTFKPTDSRVSSARTSATSTIISFLGLVAGVGFVGLSA
ncbi:hypothetical protein ACHAW5_003549 [Stephanodiscus triporus]|uniref:Uncharacterized protein n=1 Tax=Stephanodiscus triporus TaxID=2934178 RepID=A0ABD3MLJ0_9STRA